MVVRPNPDGPVIAVNNRLHIKGLDEVSPFFNERQLLAEYSEKYGGMMISF